MSQNVQAIYQNGVLKLLQPLDLEENQVVEIDVRDISEGSDAKSSSIGKVKVFEEWMANLNKNTPGLTDEQISRESIYEEQLKRQL